jgi:hypothetical protein
MPAGNPPTTYLVSLRSNPTAGSTVHDAQGFIAEGLTPTGATSLPLEKIAEAAAGHPVLFAIHGFNTPWLAGIISACRLEHDLRNQAEFPLSPDTVFIGVLWPGDWYVPVVNYPSEAFDAVKSGRLLAACIDKYFELSGSLSFVSHSLGARLALSAAESLGRDRVDKLILTAAAADNNCLVRQHALAHNNAKQTVVLHSKRDMVLRFAYPFGDFISDIFGDGDNPFGGALGYRGPKPPTLTHMLPYGIAGKPHTENGGPSLRSNYDHTDYFPSSKTPRPPVAREKSETVTRFIAAAYSNNGVRWP